MNARTALQFGAWLLPASKGKNAILRALGHQVHPTATANRNIVWRAHVRLDADSRIGRFNVITGNLTIHAHGKVTSRHHTAGLTVGEFASVAGHESYLVGAQVGARSFVGARCTVLADLPERSVLAAGSTHSESASRPGLWAGSPAAWKKPLSGAWFDREHTSTRRVLLPDGEIVEDAI